MTSAPAPEPVADTDAGRNTGLTTIPVYMGVKAGTLAGTILLPEGKGPFPVVLIIAGSGPTDRDGNSGVLGGSNNSLKMLAEGLAKRGIASLRYDKRGVGASKDAVVAESDLKFDDFIDDAVEWVKLLRDDDQFSTVTIVGHSEGSLIGMVAAERAKADAFVSLAGSGRSMSDVLREQLQAQSMPNELRQTAFSILGSLDSGKKVNVVPAELMSLFRPSVQPFWISMLKYDPAREVVKFRGPVLVAQGTTDIQLTVGDAERLAAAVDSSGGKEKLLIVNGMNHVLKSVPTVDRAVQIRSYTDPNLPVAGELLDGVAGFVEGVGRRQ